jgi:hypothetical protein
VIGQEVARGAVVVVVTHDPLLPRAIKGVSLVLERGRVVPNPTHGRSAGEAPLGK